MTCEVGWLRMKVPNTLLVSSHAPVGLPLSSLIAPVDAAVVSSTIDASGVSGLVQCDPKTFSSLASKCSHFTAVNARECSRARSWAC